MVPCFRGDALTSWSLSPWCPALTACCRSRPVHNPAAEGILLPLLLRARLDRDHVEVAHKQDGFSDESLPCQVYRRLWVPTVSRLNWE